MQTFFKTMNSGQMIDFDLLGLAGTMSSWLKKVISGGGAIRISWYALFEKINSRGDVYSGLDCTFSQSMLHRH